VIIATPIDLNRVIKIKKPNTRVYYDLQEIGQPDLTWILNGFLKKNKIK
jgi:predicted GTPase